MIDIQQKWNQDVKISQNAPGQNFDQLSTINGQRADVARSTADMVQSVGQGSGSGAGDGHG